MAKKLNTDKPTGSKKPRSKSKKAAEPVNETATVEIKTAKPAFCQYCRYHSNKPSECSKLHKYVARKGAACAEYKEVA